MIGELLALFGAALVLLSGVGVNRFRDTLSRLHALAKASTLGILLILAFAVQLWSGRSQGFTQRVGASVIGALIVMGFISIGFGLASIVPG